MSSIKTEWYHGAERHLACHCNTVSLFLVFSFSQFFLSSMHKISEAQIRGQPAGIECYAAGIDISLGIFKCNITSRKEI